MGTKKKDEIRKKPRKSTRSTTGQPHLKHWSIIFQHGQTTGSNLRQTDLDRVTHATCATAEQIEPRVRRSG